MAKELARSFAFVIYPESAPENWRVILDDLHIQWAESPLHCFDTNEGTGELKKPHIHIALNFEGKKSIDQVNEMIKPLNGTIAIKLNSLRGMIRYFAHLDNPEKHLYPVDQIVGHGGLDVQDLLRLSASARYALIRKICEYVVMADITEFYEIMDYAAEYHPEDWYPLLCDQAAYIVNMYIKSNRQRSYNNRKAGLKNE